MCCQFQTFHIWLFSFYGFAVSLTVQCRDGVYSPVQIDCRNYSVRYVLNTLAAENLDKLSNIRILLNTKSFTFVKTEI